MADLVVVKTDSQEPVAAASSLTYFVTLTNIGPSTAQRVVINDGLPAGVTLVFASSDRGFCSDTTCELGSVPPGGRVSVSFVVQVNPGTAGSVLNTACASSSTPDPNPDNNCDSEATAIAPAVP